MEMQYTYLQKKVNIVNPKINWDRFAFIENLDLISTKPIEQHYLNLIIESCLRLRSLSLPPSSSMKDVNIDVQAKYAIERWPVSNFNLIQFLFFQ